jgi:hypothetical protein
MSWFISINGNTAVEFSSLGCRGLRREVRSQAPGTFSFTQAVGEMDQGPLAVEGQTAVVNWMPDGSGEGQQSFYGRVSAIPRAGEPGREEQRYVISDAWLDFERIIYQQQWNFIVGVDESGARTTAAQYLSNCILGMDLNGNALSSADVITDVVNWAIGRGALCQVGTILRNSAGASTAAPAPFKEISDLACAQVLHEMLRLTPDAVAWFDHSTTPPTFNVTRRGDCTGLMLPFTGVAEDIELTPRHDLVRTEVVIRYVQVNENDGVPSTEVTIDAAPGGADGLAYDAYVATVRLAGSHATYQKQPVQTSPIQAIPSGDDDTVSCNWWGDHVDWLYDFSASRLNLEDDSTGGYVAAPQYEDDGQTEVSYNIEDYPNELIKGNLADWMGVKAARVTFYSAFTYMYPDVADDESRAAMKIFGGSTDGTNATDTGQAPIPVTCTVMGTNAATQTYARLSSYTSPEPVPAGLAGVLFSGLSALHYSGRYAVTANEAPANNCLGVVLNISGSQQEWATMNALVQEIVDELDIGRTTMKVGPPAHLTIQDLMEQLRYTRTRIPSKHVGERESGTPSADVVDGTTKAPLKDGGGPPTAPFKYPWIDYIEEQDDEAGNAATWDALAGYGQSSFAGPDGIDHAGPLEKLEISVGNDGSGWNGPADGYDATSLQSGLSIISGDETASQDQIYIAAYGGAIKLAPDAGAIYIGNGFDSEDSANAFINLDRGNMVIEISDEDLSYLKLNLADSPEMDIYNANTYSTATLDENSLTITAGSNSTDDATITLTGQDGGSITLDTANPSLELADAAGTGTITADASELEVQIPDSGGLSIELSLGGSPTLDLKNTINGSECLLATSSLNLSNGPGNSALVSAEAEVLLKISDGRYVLIQPMDLPSSQYAQFQSVTFMDGAGTSRTAYFLCTTPA